MMLDPKLSPAAAALAAVLAACTAAAGTASPSPSPAPAAEMPAAGPASMAAQDSLAASLRRATTPSSPKQARFAWSLDEAGSRFSGSGVARYVAPERFRLDLFGPRGETYAAAALVGEQPRVPPQVEERFKLPSPALLWAAVGVVRPPSGARLTSATSQGGQVTLRYDLGSDGTLEYRAQGSRLASVRRVKSGGVQETVELTRGADGALRSARYRNTPAYRTLNLTLQQSTDAASFPEDIWSPPGAAR
ncbi:MAG TPA: hypothetical protein VFJ16_28815 [Longimicrobium sp.]|nr:hypothetical protein [Longimicrobium sp.]